MNKRIFYVVIFILLCVTIIPTFSNELSAVWSRIYNSKEHINGKLIVMQKIVDLHDRGMEPVITEALKEAVYSRDESLTFNERALKVDLIRLMILELGRMSAVDSAPEIYKVMKDTEDEFLRADAIVGLGMIGARDYADEVADLLRYINYEIVVIPNPLERESVVDACVFALERFKNPVGFEPVLFASVGRYARSTVIKAEKALRNMLADPTDVVIKILKADNTFQMRLQALGVEDRSDAAPERKTETAAVGVEVGIVYNVTNSSDIPFLSRTKIKACDMIRDYGYPNPSAIEWLGRMLNSSTNVNELVSCLQALGVYKSEQAVEIMAEYLDFHNELKAVGKNYDDERAIRECINSLGKSASPLGREALMMVEFSGWSSQTIRMAQHALKSSM